VRFVEETMADDLARLEQTPGNLYNFHPGSHGGRGAEAGVAAVAKRLDAVLRPDLTTTLLLETMSGKGNELGGTFEELRAIIDAATHRDRLGVCLDTCHVFDAGYDIAGDLDGVLKRFDDVIGLERLKAIHLNDSQNAPGSRKDRHAKLGEGRIGLETIARIVNHEKLKNLPFLLETPNDVAGYGREIAMVKAIRR
jgi:deoxyribonuclease-4